MRNDVEFEIPEEEEERVSPISIESVANAVVSATDWTTETVLLQLAKKNINITPLFQRRDAWDLNRKSRFIESLILGLPIPQIVLAEKMDERGKFYVLDGKQRLLTLLQFTGAIEGKKQFFRLRGLEVLINLNKVNYKDLCKNADLSDYLTAFQNQPIRAVVIRNWPNNDFLHMVFVRLNTGSVPLAPQELRQALFPGQFVLYVDEQASASESLRQLLNQREPDFRMRDVELLTRYLAFSFFLPEFAGDMKRFLDEACEKLNDRWEEQENDIKERAQAFDSAIRAGFEIFGEDGLGRKWTAEGQQPRLNRAVLDVILFYFSDQTIREAALARRDDVKEAFVALSTDSIPFRKAIETTTKSLTALSDRLLLWGQVLSACLELQFQVPRMEGERIVFESFWS